MAAALLTSIPQKLRLPVLDHTEVRPNIMRLVAEAPEFRAVPGQFVHVLCGESWDPLLRRPLSIHNLESDRLSLLYEICGKGTQLLARKSAGDMLDLIGPLGSGFDPPKSDDQPVLLIGGGIGVAPLYFLSRSLIRSGRTAACSFLIGARTANSLVCLDEISECGMSVIISTDDGTMGYHGFVSCLLDQCLASTEICPMIYACGPTPMLKAVVSIAETNGTECQISTEAKMACGVGACMSCAIMSRSGGYVRTCKEGPVFYSSEVIL